MFRDWGIYVLLAVGTAVLAFTPVHTQFKSVLDSSNPALVIPLGIVLLVLIGIVAYFKSITPRRRLYEDNRFYNRNSFQVPEILHCTASNSTDARTASGASYASDRI